MHKARHTDESGSEMSLVPALILLLLVMCLYFADIGIFEFFVSAIEVISPTGLSR